jgi:thiamine biosynthesis lipoprotein
MTLVARILVIIFLINSCDKVSELKSYNGFAFGTTYSIILQSDNELQIKQLVESIVLRINKSMSTYVENSIISNINIGNQVEIDTDFENVFNASKLVWQQSNGYFDPTVGSLVNAYGFGPSEPINSLNAKVIDSLLEFTGFSKIKMSNNKTIKKDDKRIYIDFNAIAKGYAVDIISKELRELGYKNFLVEIGGEVFAEGINTLKGTMWTIGIDKPLQKQSIDFISSIQIRGKGMATSGNYRKYKIDKNSGEKYVHTINPLNGLPVKSNILSATVVAESSMLADAYATALMAMPLNEGEKLVSTLENVDAMWIISENKNFKIVKSSNFKYDSI